MLADAPKDADSYGWLAAAAAALAGATGAIRYKRKRPSQLLTDDEMNRITVSVTTTLRKELQAQSQKEDGEVRHELAMIRASADRIEIAVADIPSLKGRMTQVESRVGQAEAAQESLALDITAIRGELKRRREE